MGIVGGPPESGVRILLERARDGGPPWRYEGTAVTPTHSYAMRATVTDAGDVEVELDGGAPGDLALRVRTMIRTAHKHARDEDPRAPPPRQLQRWRGGSGVVG
jgi:hypothetical protein